MCCGRSQGAKSLDDLIKRMATPLRTLVQVQPWCPDYTIGALRKACCQVRVS